MKLIVLGKKYSVYKFKDESDLPGWIYSSDFYSITKTKEELSVVASQIDHKSDSIACSKNWKVFKIIGPLDLASVGIIADVSIILKEKNIPIFTISTYDTDYFLIKQKDLNAGIKALSDKGHEILIEK
jgi:uncharacterized protein